MTDPQVAEIVGRLSKAQREAVLGIGFKWRRTRGPGKGLYKSAALRPLVDGEWSIAPGSGQYSQWVRLTDLGLAVRNFIKGTHHDHD